MTSMTVIDPISILKLTLAAGVSAAVVIEDLQHRRIPNSLCAVLLATGVATAGFTRGWTGLKEGLLGAVVGFAVFLIPYGLGGLGGGDVKLMAGFGAMTGIHGVMPALFLAAVTGAATSILYLLYSRMRGTVVPVAIPYAPSIVAGSLIVAFSQMGGK
jgi:prepilin peptidase CpaA